MKIHNLVLGELQTNCYVLVKNNKALIIDPADSADRIIDFCASYEVVGILVTHFHFDHIGALKKLEKHFSLKANQYEGKDFVYEVLKTPGHTDDSISFYFKDEGVMFVGDFIFEGTIGRYDFANSSAQAMQESLEMISKYPGDIILYPGHGPNTVLQNEKDRFKYYF